MCIFDSLDYFNNSISVLRYYPNYKYNNKTYFLIHCLRMSRLTTVNVLISNFNIGKTLNGVAMANFLDPSSAKFRK